MKRSSFLEHVGWTGVGVAFTLGAAGTIVPLAADATPQGFNFIQISDSHIGFHLPANDDVAGTLTDVVDAINARPVQPDFIVHTGDISHLAKPAQFDDAKQILSRLKAPLITIPGEHDVIGGPQAYFAAFGTANAPKGWNSFDKGGIHFVSLVNVFNFEKMGTLGSEQLDWLANDLKPQKTDTPIVVFGHVPLYALYPQWGWTTEDGSKALAMLARFSAVTVLNGHIHQIITHTDGNIAFHSAHGTAYPLPAPGSVPIPAPLKLPKDQLLKMLGYRSVQVTGGVTTIDETTLA